MLNLQLKPTTNKDLEHLFIFQTDEQSNYLAAFTPADPFNKEAYMQKWTGILQRPDVFMQTICINNEVVGSVARFFIEHEAEVSYWLNQSYWNKGIATAALKQLIMMDNTRPLFARVAFDNIASQRVLEKCGFLRIGENRGYANARNQEIEEFIYKLV